MSDKEEIFKTIAGLDEAVSDQINRLREAKQVAEKDRCHWDLFLVQDGTYKLIGTIFDETFFSGELKNTSPQQRHEWQQWKGYHVRMKPLYRAELEKEAKK